MFEFIENLNDIDIASDYHFNYFFIKYSLVVNILKNCIELREV